MGQFSKRGVWILMMDNSAVFRVEHLSKSLDSQMVIKDISVALCQGRILGIYGANASAKTTLLRVLSGVLRADNGRFYVNGTLCQGFSHLKALKLGIAAIFGDEQILFNMSIPDNIFLGAFPHKLGRAFYHRSGTFQYTERLLALYNCDFSAADSVRSLTVAQRQTLLILRALVHNAKAIIVDDVFADMDDREYTNFNDFLHKVSATGVAILIASQNIFQLSLVADELMAINDGVLNKCEHISELSFETKRDTIYPKIRIEKGSTIYQCINLSYLDIIRDISITVGEGEIVGIIGASGSGRSVLARTIAGHLKPTIGLIKVNGKHVKISSQHMARRYGISLLTGYALFNNLIPDMTLSDNMILGNIQMATFSKMPFLVSNRKRTQITRHLLSNLGIANRTSDHARILSNGTQKKLCFARSILSGSQLLLLDEPSAGVDVAGRIQLYNIINSLALSKKGILLFTSDISEALGMCDRILVLKNGEIITEETPGHISPSKLYKLIYT